MNSRNNDIAVVGMAGKFPGAESVAQFWENICEGKESIRSLSDQELLAHGVSQSDIVDEHYIKVSPVLTDIDKFDARFFKVPPVEAELIDPQLRLMLQCAWQTLEDAGEATSNAQNIAVFVGGGGITTSYYSHFINQNSLFEKVTASPTQLGNDKDFLATYISYKLNLTGPSITVQTACSTSLVALHQACKSLHNNECNMALAGGVSVRIPHIQGYHHKEGHIVSKSGQVKTFDESADGTLFGSGLGLVLVKRLDDAVKDGNRIYALIKGSSISNDGKGKMSYAASSARGQIRCIGDAIADAGVNPGDIGFIETHGTGTYMGDPEEVKALSSAFKKHTDKKGYCVLGAVKTNVGHLEAAAGITGFIKTVLSVYHGYIPPTLHFKTPNPRIKFEKTPFYVNNTLLSWPEQQQPRRAAINSLGVGGTNAFMVLEQYIASEEGETPSASEALAEPVAVVVSAKSSQSLKDYCQNLKAFIEQQQAPEPWAKQSLGLADLAYTLQVGRDQMDCRVAFMVTSLAQLLDVLAAYIDGGAGYEDEIIHTADDPDKRLGELFADNSTSQIVAQWLAGEQWSELISAWVNDIDVDFSQMYAASNRRLLSLPGYAFAKERHWVETGDLEVAQQKLHPLLHRNSSCFNHQSYTWTLEDEAFFLRDHLIDTAAGDPEGPKLSKILPGVAYLEMARAAIAEAASVPEKFPDLVLHDVVWLAPVVANQQSELTITLSADFNADESTRSIDFEVDSSHSDAAGRPQQVLHCKGQARFIDAESVDVVDIAALRAQMTGEALSRDEIYPALAQMGLHYGTAHQGIQAIYTGDQQLLAELQLPAILAEDFSSFVLHPSLMDSALQATNALVVDLHQPPREPLLPFSMGSVHIHKPFQQQMLVWVRYTQGHSKDDKLIKLDIDLCDSEGNVCIELRGFTARKFDAPGRDTLLATPVWQTPTGSFDKLKISHQHILLCGMSNVDTQQLQNLLGAQDCRRFFPEKDNNPAQNYTELALECFAAVQAILKDKPQEKVLLQVVATQSEALGFTPGLVPLLQSATMENPNFIGQVILLEDDSPIASIVDQLNENKVLAADSLIRYRDNIRQVSAWQSIDAVDKHTQELPPIPFKDSGVYLISGGLGGLGRLFAEDIIKQTRNAVIILTGRDSEQALSQNADKQAQLEQLQQLGQNDGRQCQVLYRQLDLNRLTQVKQLLLEIERQYRPLNGILHTAGMILDNFIVNKSADECRQVMAAKVQGSYHLDQAYEHSKLDFMLLFSSLTGAIGNIGQADYAAANGFMDHFAAYRNDLVRQGLRHGHTLAINWPLWQEGGMGLDKASQDNLYRTTGIRPMLSETGLMTFYQSIWQGLDRSVVMQGDLPKMRQTLHGVGVLSEQPSEPVETFIEGLEQKTEQYLAKHLSSVLKIPAHQIDPKAPMDKYGIDSILSIDSVNVLEKSFGALSKTLFFEYQNISELSQYFIQAHRPKLNALLSDDAKAVVKEVVNEVAEDQTPSTMRQRLGRYRQDARRSDTSDNVSRGEREAIAIIGLSGRYPLADDLEQYWQNLRDGKDCVVEVPSDRWDWRQYYSKDRTQTGFHFSKWGGFINGVDQFDPRFFNISPREARTIDPQERLFLQHAWMAIEDAGYTRERLQIPSNQGLPGQVGVYAGVMYGEYQLLGAEASQKGHRTGFSSNLASIANRVSYVLNVHGPSMTVDTMCSSSLTTIHLACQDLQQGSVALAIAGGVNVTIHPNKYLMLSSGQFISSDGHCQSFGEGGDGYIPAEGVGVVVLQKLSEAKRNRQHIYGLIKGSALSHGGKTNGYTVPNPQAQASAVSQALTQAKIDPRHISYIEAHGTGTKLGDPIEIAALNRAFYQNTGDDKAYGFCAIGSAKSNIGHCESAAGIAGLSKILLQMKYKQIVPSLHSTRLNPHIDFDHSPFEVNQTLTDWQQPKINGEQLPRIAGISSFGAGGSNAHMIIEEYDDTEDLPIAAADEQVIIVLSARTEAQLRQKAQDLYRFITTAKPTLSLIDMAYTLQIGREAMDERLGFIVGSIAELGNKLKIVTEHSGALEQMSLTDGYYGQLKRNRDTLAMFKSDSSLLDTIDKWLQERQLEKLLELWAKGMALDWHKFYNQDSQLGLQHSSQNSSQHSSQHRLPSFISLPTYPFAKERYWIDIEQGIEAKPQATKATAVLHPLLHRNTSDLSGQRFTSGFSADDLWFVDNITNRAFGAGAYLEMACAALNHAVPTEQQNSTVVLHNVLWGETAQCSSGQDCELTIDLIEGVNGTEHIDFEIYSKSGDTEGNTEIVHCQGHGVFDSQADGPILDLAGLSVQGGQSVQGGKSGHGGQASTDTILTEIKQPLENSGQSLVLHPAIVDKALQGVTALTGQRVRPSLPFAVDEITIFSPCTDHMYAWLRPAADDGLTHGSQPNDPMAHRSIDISLCDPHGRVCVQLRGVKYQQASHPAATQYQAPPVAAEASAAQTQKPVNTEQSKPLERTIVAAKPKGPVQISFAVAHKTAATSPTPLSLSAPTPGDFSAATLSKPSGIKLSSPSASIAPIASVEPIHHTMAATDPIEKKPSGIVLDDVQMAASEFTASGLGISGVQLADTAAFAGLKATTPVQSVVKLFDEGDGLYAIRVLQSELTATLIAQLSQALGKVLELAEQGQPIKAVTLSSSGDKFLSGDREAFNRALDGGLFQTIVDFPYPLIAQMQGDSYGAGLLLGALCDFMVCSESGHYGYIDLSDEDHKRLYPSVEVDRVIKLRFSQVVGNELLYFALNKAQCLGAERRTQGWRCAILPTEEVAQFTADLASNLAEKSSDALRLLKLHLARHLKPLVAALQPCAPLQKQPLKVLALTSPVKYIELSEHGDADSQVLQIRLLDGRQNYGIKALVSHLKTLFEALQNSHYRSLVISSEHPQFLPGANKAQPEAMMEQLQQLLSDLPIPVVAAMEHDACGESWLISCLCDAAVYNQSGRYNVNAEAPRQLSAALSSSVAGYTIFRLGNVPGRQMLLSGADYSGNQLGGQTPTIRVAEQQQVQSVAVAVAESLARLPAEVLSCAKKANGDAVEQILTQQGQWLEPTDDQPTLELSDNRTISLKSEVISASVDSDGIVLVKMTDREAKNMFSEAFVAGMLEVFAHINENPDFKVVVLTGYDNFFASGGTKDMLIAIQEGTVKYSDAPVYELPFACQIPVISAMQGHALGAGWSLGMFADVMLTGQNSVYSTRFMNFGFTPGAGSTLSFPQQIGHDLAWEVLISAQEYVGRDLHARGLGNVLPSKQVLDSAMQLARQMAQNDRGRLMALKRLLTEPLRRQLQQTYQLELLMHEKTFVGKSDTLAQIQQGFFKLGGEAQSEETATATATRTLTLTPTATAIPVPAPVAPAVQPAPADETAVYSLTQVSDALREMLAKELYLDAAEIDDNAQFIDLGLDSITGVTFVRNINDEYGLSIEATKVYSYPTLAQMSAHVKSLIDSQNSSPSTDNVPSADNAAVVLAPAPAQAAPAAPSPAAQVAEAAAHEGAIALEDIKTAQRQMLANELYLDAAEIDEDAQFIDLGLDSITGVTFVRNLNDKYGLSIEATKVYSYPTLAQMSGYVQSLIVSQNPGPSADNGAVAAALVPAPVAPAMAPASTSGSRTVSMASTAASQEAIVSVKASVKAPEKVLVVAQAPAHGTTIALEDIKTAQRQMLANELYLEVAEIDEDAQFVDLGLDSITGVTFVRNLNDKYGLSIEATKVYSYPTLAQMSAHVHSLLGAVAPTQSDASPSVIASPSVVTANVATPAGQSVVTFDEIAAVLGQILAKELYLEASEVDPDAQFIDLGLDSITGVTFVRNINDKYGLSLEATKVYSYPTVNELSRHVHSEKFADQSTEAVAESVVSQPPPAVTQPPVSVVSTAIAAQPIQADLVFATPQPLISWRKASIATNSTATRSTATSRTAKATALAHEVAVIGMSGQFPKANDLAEYWRNIAEAKNCVEVVYQSRWDMQNYYQAGEPTAGKTMSQWMGALDEHDVFDPLFFTISPGEAQNMDPQQRVFLQNCWHAIEDAGYSTEALSGSKCGVFVGCANSDYHRLGASESLSAQGLMGDAISILAARISYFLNLQGPCLSIDTACSASLVALSNACDSLVLGVSDIALAGGVHIMSGPDMHIMTSQAGMLSPDGRCFTFDQRANGFVPGEGVGVVMLKRLADAERDGDNINGVILGWGVNQDGKTNGITAPNPQSQTRLQQEVYDRYQINPADIQLVEAHGTGTKLGDPIEVEGLKDAFAKYTDNTGYCALSSVKSNIGHGLTAAGISGFLKLLQALKHRQLPPTINYQNLNEHINLSASPFYINDSLKPWTVAPGVRRMAAINSFGMSGTNAHMVVAEHQARHPLPVTAAPSVLSEGDNLIIPLSAKTPLALKQRAADLLAFISASEPQTKPPTLVAIGHTLQLGRDAMEERLGLMVGSVAQLAEKLQAFVDGQKGIAGVYQDQVRRNKVGTSVINQDPLIKQTIIEQYISTRQLSKLLQLWVKGLDFDWQLLYQGDGARPARIALPSYPFAKERYWHDDAGEQSAQAKTGKTVAVLHPLLHRNTSDLSRQSYATTYSSEQLLLKQYRVKGQKILPAVAYLEMARAAVSQAMPGDADFTALTIEQVVWVQPLVVDDEREVTVTISGAGANSGAGAKLNFEMSSNPDGVGAATVHCQGQAQLQVSGVAPRVDIARLQQQMTRVIDVAELYAAMVNMGIEHGPSYRGMSAMSLGEQQLLVNLKLPEQAEDNSDYLLHPSIMDSAFQSTVALIVDLAKPSNQTSLPFALNRMTVWAAPGKDMQAWVRLSSGSADNSAYQSGQRCFDIDIFDDQGTVCVQIEGLNARILDSDNTPRRTELQSFAPVWSSLALGDTFDPATRVLLLGGSPSQFEWLSRSCDNAEHLPLEQDAAIGDMTQQINTKAFDHLVWLAPNVLEQTSATDISSTDILAEQSAGVVQVFRLIKALFECGYEFKPLRFSLITCQTQDIDGSDIDAVHAGVAGLIGTLAKEYGHWQLSVVDLADVEQISAKTCLLIPPNARGDVICHAQGRWQQQSLAVLDNLPTAKPLYRNEGVYVIIGGAGGLGEVFSRYMIEHHQARIFWIGRRTLDERIEHSIATLAKFSHSGQGPEYICADATDEQALAQACEQILKTCAAIDGVVHSTLVLEDQGIGNMPEHKFEAGYAAKLDIAVNMDRVFGSLALDFMLFFSSVNAFYKGAGQCNYSAGCTFVDSFADSLQRSKNYPVKQVNWGYWGSIGVVADEHYAKRMAAIGFASIDIDEGMATLKQFMDSDLNQLVILKTFEGQAVDNLSISRRIRYDDAGKAMVTEMAVKELAAKELAVMGSGSATAAAVPAPVSAIAVSQTPVSQAPIAGQIAGQKKEQMIAEHITEVVRNSVAAVVKIAPEQLDSDRSFSEYGVDSIIAVQLINQLNRALELVLQTTVLFDYATVTQLSTWLLETHRQTVHQLLLGSEAVAEKPAPQIAAPTATKTATATSIPAQIVSPTPQVAVAQPAPRAVQTVMFTEQTIAEQAVTEQIVAEHIKETLLECVCTALKMSADVVDNDRSFSEYGVDSIVAVQLINLINQKLNVVLQTTVLFDYGSIDQLSDYLLEHYQQNVRALLQSSQAQTNQTEIVATESVSAGQANQTGGLAAFTQRPLVDNTRFSTPVPAPAQTALPTTQATAALTLNGEGLSTNSTGLNYQHLLIEGPGAIDDLQIYQSSLPALKPNQVCVGVKAFSLNFGDLLCVSGMYPTMPAYPFIPGYEASGVVIGVGDEVTEFKLGDSVITEADRSLGAHATAMICDQHNVTVKPDFVSHEQACALPVVSITMLDAFDKIKLQPGESILIQTAAGGTGLIAVQLAKHYGGTIFATAGSAEKLDYLKALGVDYGINYQTDDFEQQVKLLTEGRGVDVVINTLAGDAIQKGMNCLAPGGRYIEIAMTALKSAKSIDLSILSNNQSFHCIDMRKFSLDDPQKMQHYRRRMFELVKQGVIGATICKTFPFGEYRQAYQALSDRGNIGKIVVTIEPERQLHSAAFATGADGFAATQSIAVIGMSGRFAESENLDAFWQNLSEGKDLVKQVTRWAPEHSTETPDNPYCDKGSFVDSIDRFDPMFFKISPHEALHMDPQQRVFLEDAWHCLEDAGYAGPGMNERKCGVYVACVDALYDQRFTHEPPEQAFWGNACSVVPARIAYYLNLHGPAVAVDTACSSSLVAIHLACQSLWLGESDMALAGGIFLQATAKFIRSANRAGMLSLDGKCHTFDDRANGFVTGEGSGVVMLKRLNDARKDNDTIRGVIIGSGINQDGSTNGITAPSSLSQERLERSVYDSFGIDPSTIEMVEAHGTGTSLGDPIEFGALTRSFRHYTDDKQFCAIGSVKTNIGHTITTAGIAGVLKLLLSMEHRQMPPSIHFENGNPAIDFAASPFYVNTQLKQWPSDQQTPRRGAVSSFGFSGTNAHLVLEQGAEQTRTEVQRPGHLVVLSALSDEQLRQQASNLLSHCGQHPEVSLNDLSYTLFVGRAHLTHRLCLIVANSAELSANLEAWLDGRKSKQIFATQLHTRQVREQIALKKYANQCIEACRNQVAAGQYLENLATIADLYSQGYQLDYHRLFAAESGRIPLPSYPFTKERYWFDNDIAAESLSQVTGARLHPLVHSNTSDLAQQNYTSVFSGNEAFLTDHQVRFEANNGQAAVTHKVLPAVAYLEMARAAAQLAAKSECATVELSNIVWLSPVVVEQNRQLDIALFDTDQGSIEFEIYTQGPNDKQLHCQGQVVFSDDAPPEAIDLAALKGRMNGTRFDSQAVYRLFEQLGLVYGRSHQGVQSIALGEGELLAELCLDDVDGPYRLHPGMADSALQAAIGLMVDINNPPSEPSLPFALDSIRLYRATTQNMFAWVRHKSAGTARSGSKFDIGLYDQNDNLCAEILGFSTRAGAGNSALGASPTDEEQVVTMDTNEPFNDVFYEQMVDRVLNQQISADDAGELE